MIKSIDLSDRAVTFVGLQETVEDCYHILDAVKTNDKNSQDLVDLVKDKLIAIEFEISELHRKE